MQVYTNDTSNYRPNNGRLYQVQDTVWIADFEYIFGYNSQKYSFGEHQKFVRLDGLATHRVHKQDVDRHKSDNRAAGFRNFSICVMFLDYRLPLIRQNLYLDVFLTNASKYQSYKMVLVS